MLGLLLDILLATRNIHPQSLSPWQPGQLWVELLRPTGGWLTAQLSAGFLRLVLEDPFPHTELWAAALHGMGGVFRNLSRLHLDPQFVGSLGG